MFGISSTTSSVTKRRSPVGGNTKPLRIGRPELAAGRMFSRTFLDSSFSSGETPGGRPDPIFGTPASWSSSGLTAGPDESGMFRVGPRIVPVSEPESGAGIEPVPGAGSGARFGSGLPRDPPSKPAAKPVTAKARSRHAPSASGALRLRIAFRRHRATRRPVDSDLPAKPIGVAPVSTEHQIAAFRRSFRRPVSAQSAAAAKRIAALSCCMRPTIFASSSRERLPFPIRIR